MPSRITWPWRTLRMASSSRSEPQGKPNIDLTEMNCFLFVYPYWKRNSSIVTTLLCTVHAHVWKHTHTVLPVAKKRCVASSSCGEIFTFSSFSPSLKIEKSCCFLSWLDTLRLLRLSAVDTDCNHEAHISYWFNAQKIAWEGKDVTLNPSD